MIKKSILPKTKELTASEITEEALKRLRNEGYTVWRQNQIKVPGRRFIGKLGLSDIIGFAVNGRFVACEVKKRGDTFKKEQREFLNELKQSDGIALFATQLGNKVVILKWD